MKIHTIIVFALCLNWASTARPTESLYKEGQTLYINYGVWRNKTGDDVPERGTLANVIRLIFWDKDLAELPHSLLASIPALKEVQAEQCRLKSLRFDSGTALVGVQSLFAITNDISSLEDHAFAGVPALRKLQLQRNDIKSIAGSAFENLTKLSILELHHNRIRALKPMTFADLTELTYLDLSSNRIEAIEANLFDNNWKLEFLFLHKNAISVVAETAFSGAISLIELHLSNNRLHRLEAQTFSKLKMLSSLTLEDNQLQTFDFNTLNENKMLGKVTLTNNSLVQLVASSEVGVQPLELDLGSNDLVDLSPLIGLHWLNVSHNPHLNMSSFTELYTLRTLFAQSVGLVSLDSLTGLNKLINLDVASNQVDMNSNVRWPALETLTLTANGLTELRDNGFSESTRLQALILANNSLSYISGQAFAGLVSLVQLNLTSNVITDLHPSAFADLKNLRRLFLADNRIHNLDGGLFKTNRQLYRLDLSNNLMKKFDVTTSVKSLNLAGNKISNIEDSSFENSSNLIKLDLVGNQLSSFNFDVLKPCRHFRQLKLASNNLTTLLATKDGLQSDRPLRFYLEKNDLTDISNLTHFDFQELDLSNNSRLQLQPDSFANCVSLEYLGLQGVNLNTSQLQSGLLKGLAQLKTLILASNNLQVIDVSSLPASLEFLNANKANLREIVGFNEMLEILPNMMVMSLAGNKWSCDYWTMMKENFNTFGVYQPESCQVPEGK